MRRPATREGAPAAATAPLLDRSIARDLAGMVGREHRLGFARAFTFRVATAYAASLRPAGALPRLPGRPDFAPLSGEADGAALQLGAGLAGIPAAEAAYLLGSIYTSVLPADFRAAHGVFYTPPEIVRHTLDMAERGGIDWRHARCLDPSAGGGAFIVEMIRRIAAALPGTDPALLLRRIAAGVRGYDLDPFGAWLAQAVAHVAVAELEQAAGRRLAHIVHTRDSLELSADDHDAFDLVASNVPFGRVTLPPARRAIYARSTYGHANLYALFADAGLRYARAGGVVAYVMPTSMLSGLYFRSLRALLAAEAPPHQLTFVTERSGVFDDALQETMLATYRKGRRNRTGAVHFLTIDGARGSTVTNAGTFALPAVRTAPWILPRTPEQAAPAAALRRMDHRLATYGYGVSTGPLVWNRHKPQFRAEPEPGALPVVWAEAISADGRFAWRAARRGHLPWFAPAAGKDDWLIVRRACVLLQRTTAKEQERRLIAAEMPESFVAAHRGGVIVENHLNMIRSATTRPAVPPAVIAAILNSRAADIAFRCISGSVAVSAFELEALPLPAPGAMRRIAALLERRAPAEEIAATIGAAYGLRDAAAAA
jgi:adenine-specific DNA-methyltransferase